MTARPAFLDLDLSAWFKRIGEPVDDVDAATIASLLRALEVPPSTAIEVIGGLELGRLLHAEEHDNRWWDADEGERQRLWDLATDRSIESVLVDALHSATAPHVHAMHEAASRIARSNVACEPTIGLDAIGAVGAKGAIGAKGATGVIGATGVMAAMVDRAVDAAMMSLHQRALAELSGAPDDHYFRIKFALFAAGRWPLGVRSGKFYLA